MFNGIIVYDSFVKLKGKFVSVRTTKPHRAGGGKLVSVQIRNIGTRRRRVVSFTPRPLHTQEEPRYPLHRRLGRPQSQSVRFWRSENLFFQPGVEPRTVHPAASRYTNSAMSSRYYTFVVRKKMTNNCK
jgi:hypothetical protein